MKSSLATFTLLVLSSSIFTGVQAGTQDHFILTDLWTLAIARVDSIISPGKVSGHAHNLIGGSLVGKTVLSPSQLQTAACSSCIIGADKSNYWAAQLFWRYPDNTYEPLLNQNRIYYFLKGDTKPFPQGLRMITGLSQTRNASAVQTTGVRISCNHELQTKYLPNGKTHPEGCTSISLGIFYPSCGLANGALDSPDHFSHMAWPISWNGTWIDDPNGVTCPSSHPIKYPAIFMENNYYLSGHQTWRSGDENILVLANGDTTGLAFHADYVYGWDQDVLTKTIEQCGNGHGPGEALTECAPLAASMSISKAWDCRLEGQIPDEDMGLYKPLHSLPGCNPLWTAEMPDVHPKCSNPPSDPPFVAPNVYFENLKYREHIPMAFTLANNASDLPNYTPSIGGGLGYSSLYWWADQVLSSGKKPKIQSSTTEQVVAGRGGSGSLSGAKVQISASHVSSSKSAKSSKTDNPTKTAKPTKSVKPTTSAKPVKAEATTTKSAAKSAKSPAAKSASNKAAGGDFVYLATSHSSASSSTHLTPPSSHTEAVANATTKANAVKSCNRKKRDLEVPKHEEEERTDGIHQGLVEHVHRRRSQRSAFGH